MNSYETITERRDFGWEGELTVVTTPGLKTLCDEDMQTIIRPDERSILSAVKDLHREMAWIAKERDSLKARLHRVSGILHELTKHTATPFFRTGPVLPSEFRQPVKDAFNIAEWGCTDAESAVMAKDVSTGVSES